MPKKAKKAKKKILISGYKDWVRNRVAYLRDYYFLQVWDLTISWADDQEPGSQFAGAQVSVDSKYLDAHVTMFPVSEKLWSSGKLDTLGFFLIHEMSHIILDPLYCFAQTATPSVADELLTKTLEQQNQTLARIVQRGLPRKFFTKEKFNL